MLLIICILAVDSILPLPDLSKEIFPEPGIWIPPEHSRLVIGGYGFEEYGGEFSLCCGYFDLRSEYEHDFDWDKIDQARLKASAYLMMPRSWIKPSLAAIYYARDREYIDLQAACACEYYVPWSVFCGQLKADNWYINDKYHKEQEACLSIIFDRLRFPYGIGFLGRVNDQVYGYCFTNIRIEDFFIELSSQLLSNFPSPRLEIKFIMPELLVGQTIESGIFEKKFQDYLDPQSPEYFAYPAPSESLHVRLSTYFCWQLLDQSFAVSNTYAYWKAYPTINRHFLYTSIHETQINDFIISISNKIRLPSGSITNRLGIGYHRSDSVIVFHPGYSINDTMTLTVSHAYARIVLAYYPKREGFEKELPPWLTASTTIGFNVGFAGVFLTIDNISDFQNEVFDGIFYQPRRFVVGSRFTLDL